jgi:hypothetical protein
MFSILHLGLMGLGVFVLGIWVLGLLLRKNPTKANAEKLSRLAHLLFFAGLWGPGTVWIVYPGLTQLDGLAGLDPLPFRPFYFVLGLCLGLPGAFLLAVTNKALRSQGRGANAFCLTERIVAEKVYTLCRNPMSLGYYLFCLGIAFACGSTLLSLAVLLGLIPAHVFFLKYFEELELRLRFGEAYARYGEQTPFLLPRFAAKQ